MRLRPSTETIKRLLEGVRPEGSGFVIDFDGDTPDDLINLRSIDTKAPKRNSSGIIKYSPYSMKGNEDDVARLREALKTMDVLSFQGITRGGEASHSSWEELLDEGARRFVSKVGVREFDVAITPQQIGGESPLANQMLASLQAYANIGVSIQGGITKSDLSEITIDEDRLLNDLGRIYDEKKAFQYYNAVLGQFKRAKSSGVFKIRRIMGNWRKYITKFLKFKDQTAYAVFHANTVLFIDDFHTSTTTLSEAARLIWATNPNAKVYVYTLAQSYGRGA